MADAALRSISRESPGTEAPAPETCHACGEPLVDANVSLQCPCGRQSVVRSDLTHYACEDCGQVLR